MPGLRNFVALGLLFVGVGYSVFAKGGVWPQDWNVTLVFLGLGVLACWIFKSHLESEPRLLSGIGWPVLAVPCYVLLQLVPLPQTILTTLSPMRAEQLHALQRIA